MSPLATAILALAIAQAPPGRSSYSFEALPECGTDSNRPRCALVPACDDAAPICRPPRWSSARGAWVRLESRQAAIRRYAKIATSLADTAERLIDCDRARTCAHVGWTGSEKALALSALTVALHESGLREDVQFGYPPLGRGPAGEACLLQLRVEQVQLHATWLDDEQRAALAASAERRERLARSLLGDSKAALGRCFEVGMRMLARARAACGKASVSWAFGMFSIYGSGRSCNVPAVGASRSATFQRLVSAQPKLPPDAALVSGS